MKIKKGDKIIYFIDVVGPPVAQRSAVSGFKFVLYLDLWDVSFGSLPSVKHHQTKHFGVLLLLLLLVLLLVLFLLLLLLSWIT